MNSRFLMFFLLISVITFSQKKINKKFETNATEINIYTVGLDTIILENSNSDFFEVYLYAESYDSQFIILENSEKTVNIKFAFEGTETREVVFRKFITKRLQRANSIIKIPKGKMVYIYGENTDIESKNHKNDLAIYIENGIVKLNEIQANTSIKLYSGNVYASIKNTDIDVKSNKGKIEIDGVLKQKKYKKTQSTSNNKLKINTIKGNVFLKTE